MRRLWVVGGTSGIGKAVAEAAIKLGWYESVAATGEDVDVRFLNDLWDAAEDIKPTELVYCAGVNYLDWSDQIAPENVNLLYDINVTGLIRVLQVCPNVERVVVIGSDAAWRPMRTSVAYCASKAALHMAVACIARERASDFFRINIVAPGKVSGTAMTEYVDARSAELRPEMDHIAYQQGQIPTYTFAEPCEVAEVVCNVLGTDTPYLNGAVIPVNGGRS